MLKDRVVEHLKMLAEDLQTADKLDTIEETLSDLELADDKLLKINNLTEAHLLNLVEDTVLYHEIKYRFLNSKPLDLEEDNE